MYARTARESIEHLLGLMRNKLVEAGVPKSQIRMRSGSFLIEKCAATYDWLFDIKISEEFETGGKELLKSWKRKRPSLLGKDRPNDIRETFNAGAYSC